MEAEDKNTELRGQRVEEMVTPESPYLPANYRELDESDKAIADCSYRVLCDKAATFGEAMALNLTL